MHSTKYNSCASVNTPVQIPISQKKNSCKRILTNQNKISEPLSMISAMRIKFPVPEIPVPTYRTGVIVCTSPQIHMIISRSTVSFRAWIPTP